MRVTTKLNIAITIAVVFVAGVAVGLWIAAELVRGAL